MCGTEVLFSEDRLFILVAFFELYNFAFEFSVLKLSHFGCAFAKKKSKKKEFKNIVRPSRQQIKSGSWEIAMRK